GVYYLHDFTHGEHDWACGTGPEHGAGDAPAGEPHDDHDHHEDEAPAGAPPTGLPLRAYRIAMACTGEYGAYQSTVLGNAPNVTDAMAAIVSVVNRCNLTFEADLGVSFVLIGNNDLLAYFDPATDPYANSDPTCVSNPAADCSGGYLGANISNLNSVIGSANFEIGHLLTRIRGGVAYLRSTCTANKGGGISGVPRGGEVEPASALVPMHELGHQFGGNHTLNGQLGRCNGNATSNTRWEPGGGSTLLSYAGACPVGGTVSEGDTDNLVQFAEPYFHTGNLIEMRSFLAGTGGACSVPVNTPNLAAPVITSTTSTGLTIPPGTPFALSGVVMDDGANLVYSWEQLDIGPTQRLTGLTSGDNGTSPLFRTFLPSANPVRSFPRMADVLTSTATIGEQMPTVAGSTRKFRLTVRDNMGRSTTSDLVRVMIGDGPAFNVTAPPAAAIVLGPSMQVEWTVGASAIAPIATANVEIALSLDGGATFPHVLAAAAPNTGTATLSTHGLTSSTARVRIAANGNVYFNVSGAFELRPPCATDFTGNGLLSPDDLDGFITSYFSDLPTERNVCDFNNDGFVEPGDLDEFITAYFAGC
ncbi:MAG: reprolysin-like metallopeptidase, partial [Phycisphaerales bacterium]